LGMSPNASALPLPELVPEQEFLTAYVDTVLGPIEFRVWKKQLERINEILGLSDVEKTFQRLSLGRRNEDEQRAAEKDKRPFRPLSAGEQAGYQRLCSQVLRCNVVQTLMGEDFRGFACRLAESPLLQWFCKMDRLDEVRIPGKSTLQRYSQWLPEQDMRQVIDTLLESAAEEKDEAGNQKLELAEALDLESYFLDTTCVKLNIHFPVDWVLLRDAARTLMKATMLIRKRGLKVRMEEPEEFLKRMNQLCIRMTHSRRKKDGKRVRKAVLREMKKLSKIIAGHAERHREVLEQRWQETDLKEGEVRQILERIGEVVEKLPAAIRQAHERIIGERQVKNEEKILSLYEDQVLVYVRGKAGAEVEFGRQLLLGESPSGVIVDWELVDGKVEADTKMLRRSLERMKQTAGGQMVGAVAGDRGFDSKANREMLDEEGIYNGICPKAPDELKKRMREKRFVELQKRRSQTEARIAIFKNGFLGSPLRSKGQGNQECEVAWNVLTHNLWVIARRARAKAKAASKPRALAKAS
jgi:Transposase DDE domain